MSADSLYPVRPEVAAQSLTDEATYKAMYQQSVINPDGFWREQAKRLDWMTPFTKVKQTSFDDHHVDIKWFADGTLNVSANCLDRHLAERGDQIAIIWEGDDPADHQEITYKQLHEQVCKFANALRGQDVHRGDVVTIYMPMIPEAVVAMLACTRIGAIHSVVFGGFSPEALAGRIIDCQSKVVITADEGVRGGKKTPLKANVDDALANPETSSVQKLIVCKRTGGEIKWHPHRDVWYEDLMKVASSHCAPKEMGAEDPLFILYTSGSTGKPKGVLHTTGGYLLYAALTHECVFDYKPGEVYWCTADVGWVTGHSYIVYGPLANGATTVLFEGVPNYPGYDPCGEDHRQAQGQHSLHRTDRDPRHDGPGQGGHGRCRWLQPASARFGRRADQPGSLALVLRGSRQVALPSRRHLVADRNRRHHDQSAAGCYRAQAGFGHASVLRRAARAGGQPG